MYIKDDLVQLEIELTNFEDSFMGMSNFQKTSINKLNEINDNLVLDPFCGSGNVGRVCDVLERNFVGYDLNNYIS
jgi:hypothetical protein